MARRGARAGLAPDGTSDAVQRSGMAVVIRNARSSDSPALQDVERRAGERFRDIGLPEVADDDPGSVEELDRYAEAGRSWVAVNVTHGVVGYVLVRIVDACAHIEQMTVRPDHQGTGVGRALLERVRVWTSDHGLSAISLTTFTDVAWNRPLWEHLGFTVLAEDEIGPQLRSVRNEETARGLDPERRVCMRLQLTT
jgi:GNAT superfamily N-acetyltransferase